MKRTKEEAEVVVRLDYLEQKAHICVSAWPKMARKMEKLYGQSNDGRNPSRWIVPLGAISFRKAGKQATRSKRPVVASAPASTTQFSETSVE
jgi:hypothetical protein